MLTERLDGVLFLYACVIDYRKSSSSGKSIDGSLISKVGPYLISRDVSRIRKIKECAGGHGHVQDVHPCTAEYFLTDDHCENCGQGYLPKWHVRRHYQGNQHPGYQVSFTDRVITNHAEDKFCQQTDRVRNDQYRQY